jgi:hypothetical protein
MVGGDANHTACRLYTYCIAMGISSVGAAF